MRSILVFEETLVCAPYPYCCRTITAPTQCPALLCTPTTVQDHSRGRTKSRSSRWLPGLGLVLQVMYELGVTEPAALSQPLCRLTGAVLERVVVVGLKVLFPTDAARASACSALCLNCGRTAADAGTAMFARDLELGLCLIGSRLRLLQELRGMQELEVQLVVALLHQVERILGPAVRSLLISQCLVDA